MNFTSLAHPPLHSHPPSHAHVASHWSHDWSHETSHTGRTSPSPSASASASASASNSSQHGRSGRNSPTIIDGSTSGSGSGRSSPTPQTQSHSQPQSQSQSHPQSQSQSQPSTTAVVVPVTIPHSITPRDDEHATQWKQLSGIWEGVSIPWSNPSDPTLWHGTSLTFTHDYKIHGFGKSFWRGEEIQFRVVGSGSIITHSIYQSQRQAASQAPDTSHTQTSLIPTSTSVPSLSLTHIATFQLYKTHQGKYSNTIMYHGHIRLDTVSLEGEYRAGKIILTRTEKSEDHPAPPPLLSRTSSSSSTSSTSSHTTNTNTSTPPLSRTNSPLASPTASVFAVLSPTSTTTSSSTPASTPTTHGSSTPTSLAERLSGIWEGESAKRDALHDPTIWKNCTLQFEEDPSGAGLFKITGKGSSMWRSETIPFLISGTCDSTRGCASLSKQHTGRYTNTVAYDALRLDLHMLTLIGEYTDSRLTLRHTRTRDIIPLQRPHSLESVPTDGTSVIRTASAPAKIAIHAPYYALNTLHSHPPAASVAITQHGVTPAAAASRYPATLGPPTTSLSAPLPDTRHTHTSTYSTLTDTRASALTVTTDDGVRIEEKHTSTTSSLQSQSHTQHISASTPYTGHTTPSYSSHAYASSSPAHTSHTTYSQSSHTSHVMSSHTSLPPTHPSSSNVHTMIPYPTPSCYASPYIPSDPASSSSWYAPSPTSTSHTSCTPSEAREKYSLFLAGMIVNGKLSSAQQIALEKFRQQHGITEYDHQCVLAQLQITTQTFEQMKVMSSDRDRSDSTTLPESEQCKICFDAPINCVILPCGHYVSCIDCSRQVQKCPVCRGPIKEAKLIFKT